jgi:hypothetical protein
VSGAILWSQITGARQLRDAAKLLRNAGRKDLARNLQTAVKRAGQPALNRLKASARRIRVSGYGTTARRRFVGPTEPKRLRERIANATGIEYSATETGARVSFRTRSSQMGSAGKLPRYFDSGVTFRHPIMGHRSMWADEKGEPWFFAPIKDSLPDFRDEISNAIDETIHQIETS